MKPVIYQLIPRLFTNYCEDPVRDGTIIRNGSGKLNDITPVILDEIKKLGCTHIWYTGVIEHAHDADYTIYGIPRHNPHIIKGHAGSPYAITDYYDIDPDLAVDVRNRIGEFKALVNRTHNSGLKVIIDFVPNHVARQYSSDAKPAGIEDFGAGDNRDMFFSPSNNFFYITRQQFAPRGVDLGSGEDAYVEFPARASGNDCYTAFPCVTDWYDTVKLNYGIDPWNGNRCFNPIPDTWHKMLHILQYWADMGVDGFRCDMAHMVPIEFWNWAIMQVKARHPGVVFIAEIYDINLYRPYIFDGKFDYLYDKVNLYDTLVGIECHGVSAASITSCWQTVEGISPNMLNFLENHDEVRYASRFFGKRPENVLPLFVVSAMISTGPMMIYSGQELGEPASDIEGYSGDNGRTTIFDYWSLKSLRGWLNNGKCDGARLSARQHRLRDIYSRVLNLCNKEKAVSEGKFFDLMYVNYHTATFNPHKNYAFMRSVPGQTLIIITNFSDSDSEIEVNIPQHAFDYLEIEPGKYRMTDLLSDQRKDMNISPDVKFATKVPARGAVVWKMRH